MESRLARLRPLVAAADADALLVVGAENRRYLSGFTGSAGMAVVSADGAWLVVDFRYWSQAERQAPEFNVVKAPPMTRLETVLPDLAAAQGWRRLGVESESFTLDAFDRLTEAVKGRDVALMRTRGLVERLRQVKDEAELARLEAAIALTDRAMEFAAGLLEPGVTEASVAWQVEQFLRANGAEALAFPTIVAFGPNSALPHYAPGDVALRASDPIIIDLGAQVDGYCGDLTRSFCLAPADERYAERYAVVRAALDAAESGVTAGMTGLEADVVARQVIAEHGYGDFFGHSLGHGLGLAIHEAPSLGRLNQSPLPVGTVVTMEPGIYIPEWGGIRVEDVVRLDEGGARVLTGSPK